MRRLIRFLYRRLNTIRYALIRRSPKVIRYAQEMSKSPLFDGNFYLTVYPDVRRAKWDPAVHYAAIGWRQNKNPSLAFNTARYLSCNPDVARAGMNPLIHYLQVGCKEGRTYPPPSRLAELERARTTIALDRARGILIDYAPLVSVIVPNYNHEPYLKQRLDSIFQQSYRNIEVILLDDCSTDGSRSILEEYRGRYPQLVRTCFNEMNSGGVFRQWAKGIKEANGDLIWIAESDDYCDTHMLERLVNCLCNKTVVLAYGKSKFVDRNGQPLDYTFESYIMDLEHAYKWGGPYVDTGFGEVLSGLGIINTIPNASSVVFRRPQNLAILEDEDWLAMRVAGDWVFYLHVIRNGAVAYRPDATNYYRRYVGSAAEKTYRTESFYREVGLASATVARLYDVPRTVLEQCHEHFKKVYFSQVPNPSASQFEQWFNHHGVDQLTKHRASRGSSAATF